MSKKRIGVNLLCFDESNLSGTWYFFKRLWEALPGNVDAEFVFFCQRGFDLESLVRIPSGIRYRRSDTSLCRSRGLRILYEQLVLPLKTFKLDLLFSPCVANPLFHPGCPTVTTIHDLTPFFVRDKYETVQGTYVRTITRLLAKASSHIITVSNNSKTDLMHHLNLEDSRVDVVHNCVGKHDLSRIKYGNYFLSVGTLQPAKNLGSVIRAFAIFKNRYDRGDHRLVIVGSQGWGGGDYEGLIRELKMDSHIEMKGYLSDEELDVLYAGCKGLILLSLYEGFGIPPLEALSWKKPSIVSNTSSLPEVVGTTGIQVDPLDCEQAAQAMKAISEEPTRYLVGREQQLSKFSSTEQVKKLLLNLGVENANADFRAEIRVSQGIA